MVFGLSGLLLLLLVVVVLSTQVVLRYSVLRWYLGTQYSGSTQVLGTQVVLRYSVLRWYSGAPALRWLMD